MKLKCAGCGDYGQFIYVHFLNWDILTAVNPPNMRIKTGWLIFSNDISENKTLKSLVEKMSEKHLKNNAHLNRHELENFLSKSSDRSS